MPTPFESATLNLKLFDLRREPVLRDARQWFLAEFNPESFTELATIAGGARNAMFRMVLGYWDMAASLTTIGAEAIMTRRRASAIAAANARAANPPPQAG
jgi:hypothetical protein